MVSRTDAKPLYYLATAIKALRPIAVADKALEFEQLLNKMSSIKNISPKSYLIPSKLRIAESANSAYIYDAVSADCERNMSPYESINCTAAYLAKHFKGSRPMGYDKRLSLAVSDAYNTIFNSTNIIFHGSEAAVMLVDRALNDKFVLFSDKSAELSWGAQTALQAMIVQASACMQNPDAIPAILGGVYTRHARELEQMFSTYANLEHVLMRSGTRHMYLSHIHFAGKRVDHYVPLEPIAQNFAVNDPGRLVKDVRIHKILGNTIVNIGSESFILSADDVASAVKMIRSVFNGFLYFALRTEAKGCSIKTFDVTAKALFGLCAQYIRAKEDYGLVLRACNLYNMALFNNLAEKNDLTGYKARDSGLMKEVYAACPEFSTIATKIELLANNDFDMLNVVYIYHMVVGSDAGVDDLAAKLDAAHNKPAETPYDKKYFNDFLDFLKTYTLAKFITINRRLPNTDGDPISIDVPWVNKCLKGDFTMCPKNDLGKTWICDEFDFNEYVRFWNLEAGDVTLILNNPKVYLDRYKIIKPEHANELLYTLKYGAIMDYQTGLSPSDTLNNLYEGIERDSTVFVAAAKNENAKPSVKKRITFSADHEFRKVQAMVDKNVSNALQMIPGATLALSYRDMEKRFKAICSKTILDNHTLNTSQDVDGWSESQERDKFIAFMRFALTMTKRPEAINIESWWAAIHVILNKMGSSFDHAMPNGGFQGMPGRQDTFEHSALLLYFVHVSRASGNIPKDTKVLHSTCIDDCVASFVTGERNLKPMEIFEHLRVHYAKLGYKLDLNKSIISYIKAIFCSRRFCRGIEVAADFKTILKMGVSFETAFASPVTTVSEYMGAALGALNANGKVLDIYYIALTAGLAQMAIYAPPVLDIPADRAAVYCLLCKDDNGWDVPDMIQWATKDVIDKRTRSNVIFQTAAEARTLNFSSLGLSDVQAAAWGCAKLLEWDSVSEVSFFNNPFRASKVGPLRFSELVKQTLRPKVKDLIEDYEWKSMIDLEDSAEYINVISYLVHNSTIDATIINALAQCMPSSFVASMESKALCSAVVMSSLPQTLRFSLRRKCSYFGIRELMYLENEVFDANYKLTAAALASINAHEYTITERDTFYVFNNLNVINHTFADPVCTFTQVGQDLKSEISFDLSNFVPLAATKDGYPDAKATRGKKGLFVPPKSVNVLEYTAKRFDMWDPVTKKIMGGLIVLATAEDEGHDISGLKAFFISSWDIHGSVDLTSPILPSSRGNLKRLAQNPGTTVHPCFIHRNLSQSVVVNINTAIAALPPNKHMHDVIGSIIALRACGTIAAAFLISRGAASFKWHIGLRPEMVIRRSNHRMNTAFLVEAVNYAKDNCAIPWGFAQSHKHIADRLRLITQPAVTALYLKAILCEKKGDYNAAMAECTKLVQRVGESNLGSVEAIYPSEFKPRAAIRSDYAKVIKDPVALFTKGRAATAGTSGDTYTPAIEVPKISLLTAAVPHVADARSLVNIINTSCLLALQNVPISVIAGASQADPEDVKIINRAILKDEVWERVIQSSHAIFKKADLPTLFHNAFTKINAVGFSSAGDIDVQTLKSFAGKNINHLSASVLPEYARITGTGRAAYDRKAKLLVLSNTPDLVNKRKRVSALRLAKKSYLATLKERIKAIESKNVTHYADKRAIEILNDHVPRLKLLRIRKLVASSCVYTDELELDDKAMKIKLKTKIEKVQISLIKRHHLKIDPLFLPADEYSIGKVENTFEKLHEHLGSSGKDHGFDAELGKYAIKEMISWANSDIQREKQTTYAVSPHNIRSRYQHTLTAHVTDYETQRDDPNVVYIHHHDIDEIEYVRDEEFKAEEETELEYFHRIDTYNKEPVVAVKVDNQPITIYKSTADMTLADIPVSGTFISVKDFEKKDDTVHQPVAVPTGPSKYRKDLVMVILSDAISLNALISKFPDAPKDKIGMYKYIDALAHDDEWIKNNFKGLDSLKELCEIEWEDDLDTFISTLEDTDDVAADV